MANEEHVAILRKGVAAWNEWRQQQIAASLQDGFIMFPTSVHEYSANLDGSSFRDSQLPGADFYGTYMRKADFSGAMLLGANFGPKVFGLKFRDAQAVTGTSFALLPAIAIETDFRGATLHNATFEECPLEGADFREASLGGTRFLDVSLATAKGLDSCFHASPSYLDYRTLLRSGKLPTSFLRGCGLPDTLIEYLPSLIGEPLQFYSCFISHSSKDAEFVRRVYADLQNRDIRCWFAPA